MKQMGPDLGSLYRLTSWFCVCLSAQRTERVLAPGLPGTGTGKQIPAFCKPQLPLQPGRPLSRGHVLNSYFFLDLLIFLFNMCILPACKCTIQYLKRTLDPLELATEL